MLKSHHFQANSPLAKIRECIGPAAIFTWISQSPVFLEYLELAIKSLGSWARRDPVGLHEGQPGGDQSNASQGTCWGV